jgi:peptide/nickel transport system permease protein
MLTYALQRLAGFLATLVAASLLVFGSLELLPGHAAQVMLGESATPEAVAALAQELGLDRPAGTRYAEWLGGWLHGELGISYAYDTPVAELIAERVTVSLPLAALAMALTVLIGLAAGLAAAAWHRRWPDAGLMALSQLGLAIPNFWLAILLVLLFSVHLQWFSAGGFPGWQAEDGGGLGAGLQALVLPAVALALVQAAVLARFTRSAVLDVMREDFVRTARAKGLSRRATLWRHTLRNAMVPVLTIMGLQLGNLVTGAIIVENVFVLPGLGRLAFQAIANRDVIVVRDVVMLFAAVVMLINLAVDLLHGWIDPRLRGAHGGERVMAAAR